MHPAPWQTGHGSRYRSFRLKSACTRSSLLLLVLGSYGPFGPDHPLLTLPNLVYGEGQPVPVVDRGQCVVLTDICRPSALDDDNTRLREGVLDLGLHLLGVERQGDRLLVLGLDHDGHTVTKDDVAFVLCSLLRDAPGEPPPMAFEPTHALRFVLGASLLGRVSHARRRPRRRARSPTPAPGGHSGDRGGPCPGHVPSGTSKRGPSGARCRPGPRAARTPGAWAGWWGCGPPREGSPPRTACRSRPQPPQRLRFLVVRSRPQRHLVEVQVLGSGARVPNLGRQPWDGHVRPELLVLGLAVLLDGGPQQRDLRRQLHQEHRLVVVLPEQSGAHHLGHEGPVGPGPRTPDDGEGGQHAGVSLIPGPHQGQV